MNRNPRYSQAEISDIFWEGYHLRISDLEKLDLGADAESRVYKVFVSDDRQIYFLKIRPYAQALPGVEIPAHFLKLGIRNILTPVLTQKGAAALHHQGHSFILYPFLTGGTAMQKGLTPAQWEEIGSTMQAVHSVDLPENLAQLLPQEHFSQDYRMRTANFMQQILSGELDRGPQSVVSNCLRNRQNEIRHLLGRAEYLGRKFSCGKPVSLVTCHADLHKWNIFVGDDDGLYIIDWDSARLAPRECDLMYIGGNIGGDKADPYEIPAFYQGYSGSNIDPEIIAYYRFERIVEDIAEFCKQVWQGPDLPVQEYAKIAGWLESNYSPGNEYETACNSDIN